MKMYVGNAVFNISLTCLLLDGRPIKLLEVIRHGRSSILA